MVTGDGERERRGEKERSWVRSIKIQIKRGSSYRVTVAYSYGIFQNTRKEEPEALQHVEMRNIWGSRDVSYPDLIIRHRTHVLNYHTVPHEYVQTLYAH